MPSRKLALITGSLVVALGIIWLAAREAPAEEKEAVVQVASEDLERIKDTDQDGAKDWEEILRGTDPQKQDSSAAAVQSFASALQGSDGSFTNTFYDELKNNIDTQVSASGDGSFVFDANTEKTLATKVLSSAEALEKNFNKFSKNNVSIDNAVAIKTYFNDIGTIIQRYFSTNTKDPAYENEFIILARIAANKNADDAKQNEEYKKLHIHRAKYLGAANDLIKLKVPQNLVDFHVTFTNSFWNTSEALKEIEMSPTDPMLGLIGIGHFGRTGKETDKMLAELSKLFTTNKLSFEPNEPGYILMSYVTSQ